jgi:hypothetical protein
MLLAKIQVIGFSGVGPGAGAGTGAGAPGAPGAPVAPVAPVAPGCPAGPGSGAGAGAGAGAGVAQATKLVISNNANGINHIFLFTFFISSLIICFLNEIQLIGILSNHHLSYRYLL